MKISKGVITVHLKDLLKNLNHSKSTNSEFETITTFICKKDFIHYNLHESLHHRNAEL